MSLLGWVWLECFVHADVAIRTTVSAGAPPVTALVLVALVVTLAIVMAYTFQALLCSPPPRGVHSDAPVWMTSPVQAPCPWAHPSVGQVLALRAGGAAGPGSLQAAI